VICEVMKDDGTMARLPDLELFARVHGLKIGTIADLIGHRLRHETLIECVGERRFDTPHGSFAGRIYRDKGGGVHIALTHGRWSTDDEVPVRVHEPFTALDLLDASSPGHTWPLPKALATLREGPRGVAVLLNCGHDAAVLWQQLLPAAPAARAAGGRPPPQDLRVYGIGAQVLRDLGVRRMQLLGSPRRMPSMAGYGLEITGYRAAARST
jgi:3,4-dihydroxy 2-butanone 4-phosphate synthase/GTP cyclohydrolase II